MRAKEEVQRKLKKDTVDALQLPDRPRQARALGNGGGGWRAMAVNGGVGDGRQQATVDADEVLST